jgi:hypothetical protein
MKFFAAMRSFSAYSAFLNRVLPPHGMHDIIGRVNAAEGLFKTDRAEQVALDNLDIGTLGQEGLCLHAIAHQEEELDVLLYQLGNKPPADETASAENEDPIMISERRCQHNLV